MISKRGQMTQNFRQMGSPPPTTLFSQKTRLNVLSYGIKMWTEFSVLSQFTRLTDGRMDGQIFIAKPHNNNNNPICKAPECQKTAVAVKTRWSSIINIIIIFIQSGTE